MIVAIVFAVTDFVVTLNVAKVAPLSMVTVDGTTADFELLLIPIDRPVDGAGPTNVTVAVALLPPDTVPGVTVRFERDKGLIESDAPIEEDPNFAVIFAVVTVVTGFVVIENVAEVEPPAIVTDAGTEADPDPLLKLIFSPLAGAAEPMSTVPVELLPPNKELGLKVTEASAGAFTVKVPEELLLPSVALIDAVAFAATATVFTVNVAEASPPMTTTDDSTVAAAPLDLSETTAPSAPVFLESVTVPVEDVPPTTLAGDKLTLVTV